MPIPDIARYAVVVAASGALAWAAVSDALQRRIPNASVLALLALFIAWTVATGGRELVSGLAAGGVALVVTFLMWNFRVFGAGDAKLFAATALLVGLGRLLPLAVATALGGGVLALITFATHPQEALVVLQLKGRARFGRGVPYGVAIAFGGALVLWGALANWGLMGVTPFAP